MTEPAMIDPAMIEPAEDDLRAADGAGWLHPAHQALVHRRDWLRMLAPRAVGGGDALFQPHDVRQRPLAATDGSLGWVVTLCAGAGWFAGFLDPDLARAILATPDVCIAGSGAPTGHADAVEDGFVLTGRWDYASGAPMATHFTLNAILRARGEVLRDAAGNPRIRAFIVPAALVTREASWRTIGLRASASHAYRLDGARVPASHGFAIDASAATADGPLYRFPFMALAYATLAANLLGMAGRFVALALPVIAARRQHTSGVPLIDVASVAVLVERLRGGLAQDRAAFYDSLDRAWDAVVHDATADATALKDVALQLVATCRAVVDGLYPYCGLQAAREDTALNRVWRDFHTATQHVLLLPD